MQALSPTPLSQQAPLPYSKPGNLDFWLDEVIWGHRLYDEQTPWLTLMECLGVAEFYWQDNKESCFVEPFDEKGQSNLAYAPYHRLHLRNLLFNNPHLSLYLQDTHLDDNTRWECWMRDMHNFSALKYGDKSSFVDIPAGESLNEENCEFYYLKKRFRSFEDFAKVIEFLRTSALEMQSNKRWSSKFVFPFGIYCLYEDLNVKKSPVKGSHPGYDVKASSDRRFFARTGEILYLMLCRSGKGPELRQALEQVIFKSESPWNTLARLLQNGKKSELRIDNAKSGAYLPYAERQEYVCLAEDWLRLFGSQTPAYDVLPHLVRIAGLHLMRYFLNRSQETAGVDPVECVLEIMAPRKTVIRDLASQSYYFNNALSQQALKAVIGCVESSNAWKAALDSKDGMEAAKLLNQQFFQDIPDEPGAPSKLMERLREDVLKRHKQHLQKVHGTYAKEIGLASSRGSRRLRYTPTDEFLETLVLATVTQRMEFQEFLQVIYDKYRFVIGDQQAQAYIASNRADKEAFHQNAERLEARLMSIGLLQRLSDACAYVLNPYGGPASERA